ncbi:MAG: hypothetical protein K9H26_10790 [Prolixibacteraceae bacterium]|nr:hypothetical protein [Prolixibacteraceae bacterium]
MNKNIIKEIEIKKEILEQLKKRVKNSLVNKFRGRLKTLFIIEEIMNIETEIEAKEEYLNTLEMEQNRM